MKLISHRGNINNVNINRENTKSYIQEAINLGYDVEIDIWKTDRLYLGHDEPIYPIDLIWLNEREKNLWIHCKNVEALSELIETNLRVFYHQKEDYTIISDKHIWAHNLSNINNKCIIPLLSKEEIENWTPSEVYGVCSDYIELLK